jgi:hypothetical protein
MGRRSAAVAVLKGFIVINPGEPCQGQQNLGQSAEALAFRPAIRYTSLVFR